MAPHSLCGLPDDKCLRRGTEARTPCLDSAVMNEEKSKLSARVPCQTRWVFINSSELSKQFSTPAASQSGKPRWKGCSPILPGISVSEEDFRGDSALPMMSAQLPRPPTTDLTHSRRLNRFVFSPGPNPADSRPSQPPSVPYCLIHPQRSKVTGQTRFSVARS